MIEPFPPGYLSYGGIVLPFQRERVCACGQKFIGPANKKRCNACQRIWRARKMRADEHRRKVQARA